MNAEKAGRAVGSGALGVLVALTPSIAQAQLRWDGELATGVLRRALSSRPGGGGDAGLGPTLDVAAHLALLPLVRVGVYAHHDVSPVTGDDARDFFSAGLDLRAMIPWVGTSSRGYVRTGIGEGYVLAGPRVRSSNSATVETFVGPSTGNLTEVPVAIGLAYRAARRLWVTVELGTRLGFAFGGGAYGSESRGNDVASGYLELGVEWGR